MHGPDANRPRLRSILGPMNKKEYVSSMKGAMNQFVCCAHRSSPRGEIDVPLNCAIIPSAGDATGGRIKPVVSTGRVDRAAMGGGEQAGANRGRRINQPTGGKDAVRVDSGWSGGGRNDGGGRCRVGNWGGENGSRRFTLSSR